MPTATAPAHRVPRWYLVPVRALVVTFSLTLLAFALSLFLGIIGVLIAARLRGIAPNMTFAYRHIAFPIASVAAIVALISSLAMEIRHYRQTRTLVGIVRASHSGR